MSIRLKLIYIFLIVTLVPSLFIGILTFNNYRESLAASRIDNLANIAAFKADKIETYFSHLKIYFEMSQVAYVIKKNLPVLTRLANDPAEPDFVAAKRMVDLVYQNVPLSLGMTDIMLTDSQGRIVYSNNPERSRAEFLKNLPDPQQKAFAEGRNKIYFSDIYFNKAGKVGPSILITGPAIDLSGHFTGVIAAEVDMTPIFNIIQDVTGLGHSGETLLGKKVDHHVLFLNPLRHAPEAALQKTIEIGNRIGFGIQDAVQGRTGTGKFIDYRGKQVIGAWRYIPSLDWGVVTKIDADEAFSDIEKLRKLLLIILVIVFVLTGTMAFSVAQSISGPIRKFSKDVDIIGSGNLDHKVGIDLKDEIGQLSRAFDKMTDEQKRAQERLASAMQYTRSLIEVSLDPLVTISADGKITDVNEATVKATGRNRQELIGTDFSAYFTEPEKAQAGYRQVFAKGFVTDYPLTILRRDGKLIDVLYNASVYKDARGDVAGVFAAARDVTALKQTENELRRHRDSLEVLVQERTSELREGQERLQHALEAGEFGTWGLDAKTGKAWRSLRHDQIFGYKTLLPEWTYRMFIDHVLPEDRLVVDGRFGEALSKRTEWSFECRVKRADGEIRWIWAQGKPRMNEQNEVVALIGLVQDITDRKLLEEQLKESEGRVRAKLKNVLSPEGDISQLELDDVIDAKAVQSLMDDFFKLARIPMAIIDIKGRTLVGVGWQDICTRFHRINAETCRHCVESDTLLSAGLRAGEFKLYKCKNNMWDVATPLMIGDKQLGNLFMGQFFFEGETIEYDLFRSQAKQYGFNESEYMAALEKVPRLTEESVNEGMLFLMKLAHIVSDLSYSNIKLARSLSERDGLMNSLRESERWLRLANEAGKIGICQWDIIANKWNLDQRVREFWGLSPEAPVTFELFMRGIHPEDRVHVQKVIDPLSDSRVDATHVVQFRVIGIETGLERWLELRGQMVFEQRRPARFIGTVIDITERKKAEEILERDEKTLRRLVEEQADVLVNVQTELQRAKRLSDIGTLASTVAHELRNPLAAIGMAAHNIKRKAQNPDLDKHLSNIEKKISESNQIINNLLFYSRIRPPHYEDVGVYDLIEESTGSLEDSCNKHISVIRKFEPVKNVFIEADSLQIKEVANNILNNACDAVPDKDGHIEISAELDDDFVKLIVTDNGHGIDKESLEKVFDPFFTTKTKGTGLGLSVCQQIVVFHGGSIDIKSEPGKGTAVTVRLPKKKRAI